MDGYLATDYTTRAQDPPDPGEWSLIDVFARDTSDATVSMEPNYDSWTLANGVYSRDTVVNADIEFQEQGAEVFAFYKKHMFSTDETAPTQGNSQRKIVVEHRDTAPTTYWHHATYTSEGRVYYIRSTESADTAIWRGEILVSDFYHNCSKPSIAIKREYSTSQYSTMLYICYVDNTTNQVVLKRWNTDSYPTNWNVVDTIRVFDVAKVHPVVATNEYGGANLAALFWEDSLKLKFSVYNNTIPVTGDLITSARTTSNVTFRNVTYADGYNHWKNGILQPSSPSVALPEMWTGTKMEIMAVWKSESFTSLRHRGMSVDVDTTTPTPTFDVTLMDMDFVPSNQLLVHSDAKPSVIRTLAGPIVAYEYKNYGKFPNPSMLTNGVITMFGRTYSAVGPGYPGGSSTPSIGTRGGRVAVTKGIATWGTQPGVRWNMVTRAINIPYHVLLRPEPTLGHDNTSTYLAVNYDPGFAGTMASVKLPSSFPYSVNVSHQESGLYPALPSWYKPREIYSYQYNTASPAGPSSPVNRSDFLFEVMNTSKGLRKTTSLLSVSDPLREMIIRKNDSTFALFGVTMPTLRDISDNPSEVGWRPYADTAHVLWWDQIDKCMMTDEFTVPEAATFEFGVDLFAMNVENLDSSAIIKIEFCDAAEDTVMLSTKVDMSTYQGDTAIYVVDAYDLSTLEGSTVYLRFGLQDTTSAASFEIQIIQSIDSVAQEKPSMKASRLPDDISLSQNYPNPFNPTTTITYSLPNPGSVQLRVFDVLGVEVLSLVDGYKSAGDHHVFLDASHLHSGVYFYRLNTGNKAISRKMILLK